MWDAAKVVFRGKFIELNRYIRKYLIKISKRVHLGKIEKREEFKYKTSKRK